MISADQLARALGKARREGREWRCLCPAHADHNPSLEITEKGGKVVFICRSGCTQDAVIDALKSRGLWTNGHDAKPQDELVYDYRSAMGELRYQVVRRSGNGAKKFLQRRPDGIGGWIWDMAGIEPLPYRLGGLGVSQDGETVFIAEGEKDVDALVSLGLTATTNHGGAGKWRPEISRWFAGRDIVILPDNDDVGRKHATAVGQHLDGIASSVRVLELPNLPPKGDVSDWIAKGGTREQLLDLARDAPVPSKDDKDEDKEDIGPLPPEFSEEALALLFSALYRDDLRYVAIWGKWLLWNSTVWQPEETLKAFDLARKLCRAASAQADKGAKEIASAKTAAAVERLARADRRHAARADQWDSGNWTFNHSLTINLKDGTSYPPRRQDFITKSAAVGNARMATPLWTKFLDTVTAQNEELQSYLQRVAGYCMTGEVTEHALFFLYGTGANGKGVFTNTLYRIWKDYAAIAPMETFIHTDSDRHPTELAFLRGARLVIAEETEKGRRWAQSKIQMLTGGTPITARYMRQDFFTFDPQFKLMISGNHKPSLSSVNEAIRRRLQLIPFIVTIPRDDRDINFADKLKPEWPGILQWTLDGCLAWQKDGLKPPKMVTEATEAYLAEEDATARWIEEGCLTGRQYWSTGVALWESWKAWAERNGEKPGSRKAFSQALDNHGYPPEKSQHVRGHKGIIDRASWNRNNSRNPC